MSKNLKSDEAAKRILEAMRRTCPLCATPAGEIHVPSCDIERCSVCGLQRFSCDCKGHDPAFARWTGVFPGELEAKALGIDLNTFMVSGLYRNFFIKPVKK